jgi:hypothetical protein
MREMLGDDETEQPEETETGPEATASEAGPFDVPDEIKTMPTEQLMNGLVTGGTE